MPIVCTQHTGIVGLLNGYWLDDTIVHPRFHLVDHKVNVRVADVRLLVDPQFGAFDGLPLDVRRYRESEAHGRADGHRIVAVIGVCAMDDGQSCNLHLRFVYFLYTIFVLLN